MANNTDYTRLLDGYSLLAIKAWAEGKFAPIASPTFTGTVTLPTSVKIGSSTATGLVKYTNGVLSIDTTPYLSSETWRPIQVAGAQKLSNSTSSGALNFLNGTHSVQFTYNSGLYAEVDLSKYKPDGSTAFIDATSHKVATTYLPDTIFGQLEYKGTWNATSPVVPSSFKQGDYYICSTEGTKYPDGSDGPTEGFAVGDWAVVRQMSSSTPSTPVWDKVDNTDAITGIKLTSSGSTLTGLVTIPLASSNDFGIIKLGYSTSGKNYPVQLDTNGKAYVNVPWTDNNYYHTRVYSTGLKISTGTGVSDMYVPTATASVLGVVKAAAVRSSAITATTGGTVSSRYYGVELDSNGKMFVNVPWTADTNYYPTTFTWTNGTTAGPTGSLTGSGMSAVSFGAIPSASATQSGVVTTGIQSFGGIKSFESPTIFNNQITLYDIQYSDHTTNHYATIIEDDDSLVFKLNDGSGETFYYIANDGDGQSYQIATYEGMATILSNNYIAKSLLTTKGDMIYASAVNTPARLAIGSNGKVLKVSNGIPSWGDDNDHYPTTFTWTNGTSSGPTGSLTGNSGFTAVSFGAIPSASATQSGVVTTTDQSFSGIKTFTEGFSLQSSDDPESENSIYIVDDTNGNGSLIIQISIASGTTTYKLVNINDSGTHNIATQDYISSNYVPYSGATSNINLNGKSMSNIKEITVGNVTGAVASQFYKGLVIGNTNSPSTIIMNASSSGGKSITLQTAGNLTANATVTLPSSTGTLALVGDNNHTHSITANATDGIFDLTGTAGNNAVTYKLEPYAAATATSTWVGTDGNAGKFYLGTQNPSKTTRLNYNGYLYATKLYSGGSEVSTHDYYHTRVYSTGLKISTGTGVSDMYVPAATTTQSGVVTTGEQEFQGKKIFDTDIEAVTAILLDHPAISTGGRVRLHYEKPVTTSGIKNVNVNTYSQTEATNILNGLNSDGTNI